MLLDEDKTPKITEAIGKVIGDESFQDTLERAGSVGALINIGLGIYQQVKDDLKTEDERAFGSLIKVAFQTAADRVSIKSTKSSNIKKQLFDTFLNTEGWNSYLPDHPVIVQFRALICDILRNEQYNQLVRDFVFNFNITLEDKADEDPDIEPFKKRSILIERTKDLIKHLEYSRSLIYKSNPIDKRYLDEYYVENNAVLADVKTWHEEDSYFLSNEEYKNKRSAASNLVIDSVIKKGKRYTIIGAPFGIGKTSLSIYLTSTFASTYLDDPNNADNYIPIFVSLKGKLQIIDEDAENSLDDVLNLIAPGDEGKNRKILLICDGLDEYHSREDESNLKELLDERYNRKQFPNVKFIITTRLEAGFPQELGISTSSYIRLLPLDKNQVDTFFQRYGISDLNYEKLLQTYKLTEEEIRKPLFCWMFAVTMHSRFYNYEQILKDSTNLPMTRSLIYEGFIHSVIRGKHESVAQQLNYTEYYQEEKKILRKIAALKQMYEPNILTYSMVIEGLKSYGLVSYDDKKLKKKILDPIITSYFYLQGATTTDKTIDFIHKSFREYLLAEYYLESILQDKKYYLCVGIPTQETILFLDGLLELLISERENLKNHTDILIKSLVPQSEQQQQASQSYIKTTLIKRAQRYYEDEEIIVFLTGNSSYQDGKWNITKLSVSRYPLLWVHRWLSLYVLNKLAPEIKIEKKTLADLIIKTSHSAPISSKKMANVDLSGENLFNSDLSYADLSSADLSRVNLAHAFLSRANLSHANLSNSNLSYADLYNAYLSGANLSHANLSHANLSNADLSRAILSNALLSFSLILNSREYVNMKVDGTNFDNALTDNEAFITYLRENQAETMPILVKSKHELKNILERRGYRSAQLKAILENCALPYN